jgi:hypothetical protein
MQGGPTDGPREGLPRLVAARMKAISSSSSGLARNPSMFSVNCFKFRGAVRHAWTLGFDSTKR